MRLHHLSVTAFGPFAGTETLDFDALNDAGLFLLTGPTGGGKSSILDAVCFALYGQIPGVRDVKELKSQHAPDAVAPEVVLEFSVGDRRFEVRRHPEWSRPKKRSDGVTPQHASATLTRISHDDRTLVSSRIQEVGHEIADLLGMTLEQFEQVVLLPQGEFQTFLRASSQERHDVLQQLFKTHRFAHIEQWVHAHSRELKVRAETSAAAVRRIVDSIADRVGTDPPQPLEPVDALAWVDGVVDAVDAAVVAARRTAERARQREALARSAHEEAVRAVAARQRAETARLVLTKLDDEAEAARAAALALAADARASRCLPVLAVLDGALTTRSLLDEEHLEALRGLDPTDVADLANADERLRKKLAGLRAALPRLLAHDEAREAETLARTRATHSADALAELKASTTRMPSAIRQLREELARLEALAATRDAAATTLEIAQSRLEAAQRLHTLEGALAEARRKHLDARELAATSREALHDTIGRRLAGIAAELAGRLTEGEPCQVCGSPDHPAPALPCDDAVDEAQQAAAAQRYDAARAHLDRVAERARTAQSDADTTRVAAGGLDMATAAEQLDHARKRLEAAELADTERAATLDRLAALEEEHESAVAQQSTLAVRVAELTEAAEGHARAALAAARDLSAAWGEELSPGSWAGHLETLELRHQAVAAARTASHAWRHAESAAVELEGRARSTILSEGFATLDEARGAALGDASRATLTGLLESRRDAEASARAVLAEVEAAACLHQPLPDVATVADRLFEAGRVATTSAAQVLTLQQTLETVTAARTRLDQAMTDWRPVRVEADRAESIAELVRGTGPHNQLQMRLSSYVLATRLDQVVAAANERLTHMRDHRYLLRRTGRAARRNSQAGLGLEVVDQWTGSSRDPASLSGGETFVVSLALALGLADVVSDEAGGVDVATLFVDEGFGSLDADTLDDVMDRLDGLRAGGRTVGVVSHVGELRNRIPTQVHVEKRRDGSSVRVRTLAG